MKDENNDVIACFLGTSYTSGNNFFDCIVLDSNFKNKKSSRTNTTGIKQIYNIKSSLMAIEGRKKVLIVAQILNSEDKEAFFYAGYNINTNSFKEGIILEKDNCDMNTGYININFFIETEEFIVSYLSVCNSFPQNGNENNILIYSFDKNFEYSFFGTIRSFIFASNNHNDYCSKILMKSYNLHTILFSSYTQRYFFLGNYDNSEKLTSIIINKEINIINPIERNSKNNIIEYSCENFSDFNSTSDFSIFLNNSSMKYLPKCTNEASEISSCASNFILNKKKFEFSLNCSVKYPYVLIQENKCVEYCDNISISNGTCIRDYYSQEENIIISDSTYTIKSDNTYNIDSDNTYNIDSDNTYTIDSDNTYNIDSDNTYTIKSDNTFIIDSDNTYTIDSENTYNIDYNNTRF